MSLNSAYNNIAVVVFIIITNNGKYDQNCANMAINKGKSIVGPTQG